MRSSLASWAQPADAASSTVKSAAPTAKRVIERIMLALLDVAGCFSILRSIPDLDGGGRGRRAGRAESGQAHRFRPHPGAGLVLRAHVDVVEGGRWRGQIAP